MELKEVLTKERKNKVFDKLFNTQFSRGVLDFPCNIIENYMFGINRKRIREIDSRIQYNLNSDKLLSENPTYFAGFSIVAVPSFMFLLGYLIYDQGKSNN